MLIAFDAPPMSSVDPSGGDLITYSDAMLVIAPGRFSMMNCCLRAGASRSVSARVTRSVLPPAAKGLTMRTTFAGAWALAPHEIAAPIRTHRIEREICTTLTTDEHRLEAAQKTFCHRAHRDHREQPECTIAHPLCPL